ncbi:uncharacterized protein PAC_13252 [Phialocephala subalpina]|uniref:Uncharacterized protein n=1 Tax=Phialocephala subalpina TaxID=576137 RepID=A0A1L7XE95_9HELO|nr:uncharacterized protein PAC_13252 [Phialocephala subalpina]
MYSLRSATARGARSSIFTKCLYLQSPSAFRTFSHLSKPTLLPPRQLPPISCLPILTSRPYGTKSSADTLIETITDQYSTARDEFEIAAEETEKKTVYAADDRAAARDELDKLKGMYEDALRGSDGEEIKGRIGQRIRELDNAVRAMEESTLEH